MAKSQSTPICASSPPPRHTPRGSLLGIKFGRLFVVARDGDGPGMSKWVCRCDCGNTVVARRATLLSLVNSPRCGRNCLAVSRGRFWERVQKGGECWEWTGPFIHTGYGKATLFNRTMGAHRVSYILNVGPIPDGLWVLHSCDNKKCVRPDHLHLGTNQDNMDEAVARNRMPKGSRNGHATKPHRTPRGESHSDARLTESDVRDIREACRTKQQSKASLARRYGVSPQSIYAIHIRKTWRHVT